VLYNLATKKGRIEAGAFLIEGDRAIKQMISNNPDAVAEIISTEELSLSDHKYSHFLPLLVNPHSIPRASYLPGINPCSFSSSIPAALKHQQLNGTLAFSSRS